MTRTLALKRDVLQELTPGELSGVVGGGTYYSCMDFESCRIHECLISGSDPAG